MTKINVNGTELFYERFGSGIPFLVMHGGLGVDHSYFRPGLDPLGDIIEFFFYDHRGQGRSGRPPMETITFEQFADDADVLRKELGYEKIGVIGHSAGGFIALNYAVRHPNRISHLILMDTVPVWDHNEEVMQRIMQKNPSQEILETANADTAPTPEGFRQQLSTLQPLYFYDYNSDMQEKAGHAEKTMIFTPDINIHQDILMKTYNVTPHLNKIDIPTLILVGDDDFVCPPSQAHRMHKAIPNSEIHVFEKCGHYPFWESPKEFYRVVRDWVNKIANG